MPDGFAELKDQVSEVRKYLHLGNVKIDTIVFRLHYIVRSVPPLGNIAH